MAKQQKIGIGEPVPYFELLDETGHLRTIDALMGEAGLMVVFVRGTWCPQCIQTLYYLGKYSNTFKAHGLGVAIIAIDEPRALNNFKLSAPVAVNFPLLADANQVVRNQFDIAMSETYLLIDRQGIIRADFFDPDGHSRPASQAIIAAVKSDLMPQVGA